MRNELVHPIGLSLAQLGPFADLASIEAMATGAEARGYHSLWVIEIGTTEVVVDPQGSTSTISEHLDLADAIVAAGGLRTAA